MKVIKVNQCLACGSICFDPVYSPDQEGYKHFETLSNRKYRGVMHGWIHKLDLVVMQCRSCSHYWHHTIPDQNSLFTMYNSAVPLREKRICKDPDLAIVKKMGSLFKLVSQKKYQPSLLDYGSGFGRWARAAETIGFNVVAYEPSIERGVGSVDGYKFRLINSLNSLENQQFDLINLEQVLEHTVNPLEILLELRDFCHDETIIRITVPNLNRVGKDVWKKFPFDGEKMHIMSPYEHLQGFTPKSLVALTRCAGMTPVFSRDVFINYPLYYVRNISSSFISYVGQTMALVQFKQ